MGDIDHRGAQLTAQPDKLKPHLHPELGVEVRQRLVEKKHFGFAHDGPADGDALALAAGKFPWPAAKNFGNLQDTRRPLDLGTDFVPGRLGNAKSESHILKHRHMRIERIVLKHHGNATLRRRQIINPGTADVD